MLGVRALVVFAPYDYFPFAKHKFAQQFCERGNRTKSFNFGTVPRGCFENIAGNTGARVLPVE